MSEKRARSSRQKAAEREIDRVRADLGPFVAAAETTRMAMVFTDAQTSGDPIIFVNDSFLTLTGYAREEVLGQGLNFLMAKVAVLEELAKFETALAGSYDTISELHCRRKDGAEFWAAAFISPVLDRDGATVQHFASFVDLTAHIAAQDRSKMLIDELNHRVKNTLATVQSIVWQASWVTSTPMEMRQAIESRLFALSRSQDLLTREHWEAAGLLDIVNAALQPFSMVGGRADRLVISGENVRLAPKAALSLGIAFHELATNAIKYGAFSNDTGSVEISWEVSSGPDIRRIHLRWREAHGPPVSPPSRRGLGSRVLEQGLAHDLDAKVTLDYAPAGLVCTMDIPLPGSVSTR